MAGDKVMGFRSPSCWVLLLWKLVVGKAMLIWKSVNPITDEIRWNRIFKKIK